MKNRCNIILQGVQDGLLGPTLLDLADIYERKLNVISIVVALRTIGTCVGSLAAGFLLDKLIKQRYFIIFACTCLLGVGTATFPHLMFLWALCVIVTISSIAIGVLWPACNVLCLDIWKDDSGPYLQSVGFSFAVQNL